MGVGGFLTIAIGTLCIFSLLNRLIKLLEMKLKHDMSMELTAVKVDSDFKDFDKKDFEDVFEDIKKD